MESIRTLLLFKCSGDRLSPQASRKKVGARRHFHEVNGLYGLYHAFEGHPPLLLLCIPRVSNRRIVYGLVDLKANGHKLEVFAE